MSQKKISKFMNYLGVMPENAGLLSIAYYTFLTSGMANTVLGAILPDVREAYNISYVMSGTAYACHQAGNMVAALAAGYLPYLLGRKKSTTLLYLVMILGLLLITMKISPAVLLLGFVFTGLGRGMLSNITNVIVAETTENKTAGLNILHAIYASGALISPLLLIVFSVFLPSSGWQITL